MSDVVRALRLLEYIGPREWVEEAMDRRAVKGLMARPSLYGGKRIREVLLGDYPVALDGASSAEHDYIVGLEMKEARYAEALARIANMDYRRPTPWSVAIAREALNWTEDEA